jgi:hypothetical protein
MSAYVILGVIFVFVLGGILYTIFKPSKEEVEGVKSQLEHHVEIEDYPSFDDAPIAVERPTIPAELKKSNNKMNSNKAKSKSKNNK